MGFRPRSQSFLYSVTFFAFSSLAGVLVVNCFPQLLQNSVFSRNVSPQVQCGKGLGIRVDPHLLQKL